MLDGFGGQPGSMHPPLVNDPDKVRCGWDEPHQQARKRVLLGLEWGQVCRQVRGQGRRQVARSHSNLVVALFITI